MFIQPIHAQGSHRESPVTQPVAQPGDLARSLDVGDLDLEFVIVDSSDDHSNMLEIPGQYLVECCGVQDVSGKAIMPYLVGNNEAVP